MSTSFLLVVLGVSLIGVVAIGVFAFARSATDGTTRKSSVDEPGLDRRRTQD